MFLLPLFLIAYLFMSKTEVSKFLKNFTIRQDKYGSGYFNAPRVHGKHKGLDINVEQGQIIKAPFNAQYIREGFVYSDDLFYRLMLFKGTDAYKDYEIKIFYITPLVTQFQYVKQGDIIGYAQAISHKYGEEMDDHLHIEIRNPDGKLINPEIFL